MLYKDRIILLRNKVGATQKDLADYLNIDCRHYGNCEREYEIFSLKHLFSICNYFNVSLDYIFGFTEIAQYVDDNKNIDYQLSSERLKNFRKENKLTQKKLAEILNTVHQSVSNYENGKNLIATPFLYTICKKYNISADYLLGRIDSPKYFNQN